MDIFAGGAIARMSIFALSVTPYISASIVMLLVTASFPKLKALERSGAHGRRQVNQYTRYLTIALAALQAQGIAFALEDVRGIVTAPGWFFRIAAIMTLVAGAVLVMWLAEQISKQGLGNGFLIILVAGPVLRFLSALATSL